MPFCFSEFLSDSCTAHTKNLSHFKLTQTAVDAELYDGSLSWLVGFKQTKTLF